MKSIGQIELAEEMIDPELIPMLRDLAHSATIDASHPLSVERKQPI
jgi:hypothetical protein